MGSFIVVGDDNKEWVIKADIDISIDGLKRLILT